MSLEQRPAYVRVQVVREEVVQVLQSDSMIVTLLRQPDSLHEEVSEPLERVLIHGVHRTEARNGEVQDAAAVSDGAERVATYIPESVLKEIA